MFKFLKEKKKDNKGFTLVELVIVVAILAILVGITWHHSIRSMLRNQENLLMQAIWKIWCVQWKLQRQMLLIH